MFKLIRRIFLSKQDIIIKQAFEIDKLRMQCDLYEQLAIIDAETIRKLVEVKNDADN